MSSSRVAVAALIILSGCATPADLPPALSSPALPSPTTLPFATAAPIAAPSVTPSAQTTQVEQRYPDVVDVAVRADSGRFDFDVTLSSPYDTPQRYADAFRVLDLAGNVYGERILLHDHQFEQPFTRDLYNVVIPDTVTRVVVQGRDQLHGYGGVTMTVALPGR